MAFIVDGETFTARFKYQIKSAYVDSTLTNFTVDIDLSRADSVWWANLQDSSGGDIRVTLSDGTTRIPIDIININSGSQTGRVKTNVSSISSSSATDIYVYCGNETATQPGAATTYGAYNAYDSNHKMYLTLDETCNGTTDELKDRTSNQNHGTGGGGSASNCPDHISYIVDYGKDYVQANVDYIKVPYDASLNITGAITLSTFIRRDSADTSNGTLLYKGNAGGTLGNTSYGIFLTAVDKIQLILYASGSATSFTSTNALNDGTDYHIACSWDGTTSGTNVYMYVDGVEVDNFSKLTTLDSNTQDVWLGTMAEPSNFNPYDGYQDETVLSNTDRSAAWIKAYYNNLANPTLFAEVFSTEVAFIPRIMVT